jgi:hypothetical protein
MDVAPRQDRNETEAERLDRNMIELTGELRVALPGVQVLFAFLLVVPFSIGFARATAFQEKVFLATLLLTAAASALLIAPSVHHRLLFRRGRKDRVIRMGNRLAIAGLTCLGVAMTGVVMLVTDFVFGTGLTAVASAAVGALFVLVWFLAPMREAG